MELIYSITKSVYKYTDDGFLQIVPSWWAEM